jgi:TRAP-type C4-dicarboxylate transport system substrate-binding protein
MGRTILAALAAFLVSTALPAHAAQTLKFATVAPEGSYWMQTMQKAASEVAERTGGRVKFKFYTGGVMGNDKSVLRKIRVGQLDGGAFTVGGLTEIQKDLQILNLPFLFPSRDVVDKVRPVLDAELIRALDGAGFTCFGFAEAGFSLLLSPFPIRTIEDMKGRKMWVPEGDPVSYEAMKTLGLSPVTLPITDVLTGLQSGLVEVVAAPPIGAIAFQWHTRVKYVTTTPLLYVAGTTVLLKESLAKLDPADQKVVREVLERVQREFDKKNRQDDIAAYSALLAQGVTPVTPTAQEEERWRAVGRKLDDRLAAEGYYSSELYERVKKLIIQAGGAAK